MSRLKVLAHSDGSCSPNPGPGGWGVYIAHPHQASFGMIEIEVEACGSKSHTTNGEMELEAALQALQLCPLNSDITLFLDPRYVVDSLVAKSTTLIPKTKINGSPVFTGWLGGWMKKGWKKADGQDVKYTDKWKKIVDIIKKHYSSGSTIHIQWTKGHAGHYGNERADKLANEGREKL